MIDVPGHHHAPPILLYPFRSTPRLTVERDFPNCFATFSWVWCFANLAICSSRDLGEPTGLPLCVFVIPALSSARAKSAPTFWGTPALAANSGLWAMASMKACCLPDTLGKDHLPSRLKAS